MMIITFFVFSVSNFLLTETAVQLTVNNLTVQVSNDLVKFEFKSDSTVSSLYVGEEDVIGEKSFYLDWTGTGMFLHFIGNFSISFNKLATTFKFIVL